MTETYASLKKKVDKAVLAWASLQNSDDALSEAVAYAIDGGKRLRPIMLLVGALIADGDVTDAIPFAVAIELIHNYSLIHDDLPCMDNDEFRRGRPTVHKKFGEWTALLAGDALLNGAYELILDNADTKNRLKAGKILGEAAGLAGMIHGQLLDLSNDCANVYTLDEINYYKTGKLFIGALTAGATLFGANAKTVNALSDFAESFGLAFQIADDLDDYYKLPKYDKSLKYNYAAVAGEREALNEKAKHIFDAENSIENLKNTEILHYLLKTIS